MEFEKPTSATAFSKKLSNAPTSVKQHPYDGVFLNSTPSKLRSSRTIVDKSEYEEMFCGSATCSIPVLDIPDFHQGKSSLDARSSRQLDYSQIFGGFGDSTDFAVPFEELVPKPKKKEARSRAPVEAKPRTARSGHSSSSEEKQEYSADGVNLYNVSYNRTNPGSQNGEKGTAHVAQLHAVNGYTHVINESGPSPVAEGGKPERSVLNDADAHLNVSVSEPPRVPKLYRKVVSGPQPRVAASDAPQIHAESRKRSDRNRSMSNDMFDAFEIGLGGYPSGIRSPSSTTSKGTTHVAQPQAVNGYTPVIDNSVPSPVAEGGKPAHSVLNSAGAHLNVSEPLSVSGPQPRVAASDAPQIHAESRKRAGRNRSMSNDMFDAFEIGLGGYPSGIPSPSRTTSKGTTHVAQPQAVGGYTRVIDKSVPSPVAEGGKPAHSVLNDAGAHLIVSEPPRVPKLSRKAVSGPQPRVAVSDKSQIHTESMKRSGRNRSMSNDMFDEFEIGLGGYSAGIPSPSSTTSKAGYYRRVSNGSTNMKFGASRSNMSERAAGYYSPSFSDEEVDTNSAAAASAAAVRKAIEEAQAKIKLAKELMERKKEGRLNFAKLNSDNGLRAGKRETKAGVKSNSLGEKGGWKTNEKEDLSKHFSANLSKHEQIKESQVSPQLKAKSDVSTTQDVVGKPQSEGSPSTQADHIPKLNDDGELRPQISQSAVAKKHVAGTVEFEPVDDAKEVTPSANETGWGRNMTAVANFEDGMQCSKKIEVFEEDAEQGKVESKMDPVEVAFAWNADANNIELSQELEHKEEDVEARDACELGEANETPNVMQKQEQLESKPEVLVDQGTKHKPESQGENIDMQEMKEAFDRVENIDHKAEECSQDPMANGVPIREDCERRQDERHEQNGKLNGHKCEWGRVECVENHSGSSNHENNEQRENDAHWDEDTEMKLGKVCVQQVVDFTCNDLQGEVESERIDSEDDRTKGHDKVEEVNTIEGRLEGDYQMGVSEHRPDSTFEAERMQLETCLRTEDEEAMEVAEHTFRDQVSNSAVGDVICNQDGNENPSETGRGFRYGETSEDASINAELITSEPNGRTTGDTIRTEESEKEWKPVADDTEEEETFEAVRPAPGCIRLDEFPEQTECGTETLIIENDGVHVDETMLKSPPEFSIDDLEKYVEEVNWEADESDEDVDESEVRCNDEQSKSYFISENGIDSQTPCVPEQSVEDVEESKTVHDLETYFEEVTFPLEEGGDADEFENATVHGEEDNSSQFSHRETWTNSEIYVEVVQQPCSFEGSGRTAKISQEMKVCQGDENEDKNHHKAKEKEAGSQMEMRVENKHHSEKDEAKEKEMERWTNSEIHVEAVQQPCSSEGSGRTAKISQEMKACQSTEIEEENDHKAEEKEAGSQMEMGVENKHQSEKDKVKEREMDRWTNGEIHGEVVQQHCSSEGSGRTAKISQETKACQSTEKEEENHRKAEEKEACSQMEMGVENKDQSEKDEAKEREMEKERQRMVVERAIREARERAFAEARERAERAAVERAAAEARQKVTAEAWKRLEKAPVEANGKLAADKVAMEAKLKAERAAVERATAEARERALERALAEKAASKAKNRASAEKFSSASRDVGTKSRINLSTDDQQKGTFTSSSLRHSTSFNHAAERPVAPNGESAHWSKATLERHQRTAERAAKALAEKNMRDLLAQKEQAERNRLAEPLDADVKRWSSGKERNLRALISTLQYILGHDSGWQPIPLTDLISTAAVKKAYRKATLFVHPDKLQQRGASIQQKYICEKVFDLLKEAWNKFSAEER